MDDNTIIGIDEIYDDFVTLGALKKSTGAGLGQIALEDIRRFEYDPFTGQKIYWDVIESQFRETLSEEDLT